MEILELPAGSELDRVVAECVFGLKVYDYSKVIFNKTVRLTSEGRHLKEYSTDIAAAWQIVEKICIDPPEGCWTGPQMQINYRIEGPQEVNVVFDYLDSLDDYNGKESYVDASANTVPLAICRAALKVLGSQE